MDPHLDPCATCGTAQPPVEGLCPGCLLLSASMPSSFFQDEPVPGADLLPLRFGDYELVEWIDQGGMGVVYKALHVPLNRTVALKMIATGTQASDAEVHLMLAEAKSAASLEHPNIVPIYEVGVYEGRHYFTMQLMEGGSLDGQLERFRAPHEAARLLETIARAVHYGHQRGVLHRDLKPANLLLDAAGVPHVADFGLARALDPKNGGALSEVGGTVGFMAPEQADPRGEPLTVAADIYSLGGILYELLTGRLPFEGEHPDQVLAQLRDASRPRPPRELAPRIPRDLETICLKCLEKDPSQRYGSAAELADELRRYLQGKPIGPSPRGLLARAWRWCRTHPLGAGLLATLIWSLSVAAVGAVHIARAQEEELRNQALRGNVYAARLIAGAVLFELARYSHAVELAAAQPEFVAALQSRDPAELESFCRDLFENAGRPGGLKPSRQGLAFHRLFIQDTAGRVLARWPQPPRDFIGLDFGWRDYFQGARRMAFEKRRAAYVSRAFQNSSDGTYAFALSAPVYSADGTFLGVLVVTVTSDSTLGSLRLNGPSDLDRTTTLVAIMDRMREQGALPAPDAYTVLVHEQLERGMPAPLQPETARQLVQALPDVSPAEQEQLQLSDIGARPLEGYQDPVSNEPGKWLAAFAPVGHTGFVVIVQTRENAVLAVNTLLAQRIAWWSLPFALGAALVWLAFGWSRLRSRG
jgi:hypothetical protein